MGEVEKMTKIKQIKEIKISDENYPILLKQIKNPPEILYYRGKIESDENCFGIVGTRMCSAYGRQAAFEIAGDLAEAGLVIVSGLAPGIDTAAHQAAVERGKKTIAVLGTGADEHSIYPKENLPLTDKILENGGCLVSEYPNGTPGAYFTFPRRNRIISGISIAILVVEAKERSGALITADWAKKQGKKIFALPGSIHSSNSRGPHFLIKQGAKLVENADDILKELNLPLKSRVEKIAEKANNKEYLVLNAIKEGALDINKIIEKTRLTAAQVASILAILEINGKVRSLGNNIYAISHS